MILPILMTACMLAIVYYSTRLGPKLPVVVVLAGMVIMYSWSLELARR